MKRRLDIYVYSVFLSLLTFNTIVATQTHTPTVVAKERGLVLLQQCSIADLTLLIQNFEKLLEILEKEKKELAYYSTRYSHVSPDQLAFCKGRPSEKEIKLNRTKIAQITKSLKLLHEIVAKLQAKETPQLLRS